MLEALAAFAVAGNVLQFVDVSIKLVLKTSEIKHAATGQTRELSDLESANHTLLKFNQDLASRIEQQKGPVPNHLRALSKANKESLELATEYLDVIDRLKIVGAPTTLSSFKSAWKTLRSKDKLAKIQERHEQLKSSLSLAFLEVIQHEVANNHGQSMLGLQSVATIFAKEMDDVKDSTIQAVTQMQKTLAQDICSLSVNDEKMRSQFSSLHDINHTLLVKMSHRMEQVENGYSVIADAQTKIYHQLIGYVASQEQARRSILASLRFSHMESRMTQISAAHEQTFDWITRPGLGVQSVWDDFVSWLGKKSYNKIYWIQGKPGSGKSTLMKFLERDLTRPQHESLLRSRTTMQDLCVASYYFWSAGDKSQHSVVGLLRTILYSLLRPFPSHMQSIISPPRWFSSFSSDQGAQKWPTEELIQTLQQTLEVLPSTTRVVLLIDGLDEIDAEDDEKIFLITTLKKLASSRSVKICVSSRPWLIFRDEFEGCPQLQLEDLTKGDIDLYVRDTLSVDRHFVRLQKRHPEVLTAISNTIVQKAQGVFLWVRLAIRELIKEIRDGAHESQLMETLWNIPNDLDDFFRRILDSVDPKYRQDSALLLQVAACNLTSMRWKRGTTRPSPPSLKLFHLQWLDAERPPSRISFRTTTKTGKVLGNDYHSLFDGAERQKRRILSRGMGLLELSTISDDMYTVSTGAANSGRIPSTSPILGEVTFLHRTVRDWLLTPSATQIVESYAAVGYDVHLFRCCTIAFEAITQNALRLKFDPEWFLDSLTCLLSQIALCRNPHDLFDIYEYFIMTSLQFGTKSSSYGHLSYASLMTSENLNDFSTVSVAESTKYLHLVEVLEDIRSGTATSLTIATQLGWAEYVSARCTRRALHPKKRCLLDYALRPCIAAPCNPNAEVAISIIQYTRGSSSASEFEDVLRYVWPHFLLYNCRIKSFDRDTCLAIFSVLLQEPHQNFSIPPHDLRSAWRGSTGRETQKHPGKRSDYWLPVISGLPAMMEENDRTPQKVLDIIPVLIHQHARTQSLVELLGFKSKQDLVGYLTFGWEKRADTIPRSSIIFAGDQNDEDHSTGSDGLDSDDDDWVIIG